MKKKKQAPQGEAPQPSPGPSLPSVPANIDPAKLISGLELIKAKLVAPYRRTLATLFHESLKPNAGHSTELLALALRLALHPDRDIDGNPTHYRCTRQRAGWQIEKFGNTFMARHAPDTGAGLQRLSGTKLDILDCVLGDRRDLEQLRNLIVKELGHEPTTLEIWPSTRKPAFTYLIAGEKAHLWIDGYEVKLPNSADVHLLLENFCATPTLRLTSVQANGRLHIGNSSRACSDIRKALGKLLPEAASWLEPDPIAWAKGFAPKRRRGNVI